ncbi:Rv2175c family DNA-binding protein [Arcanobacterium pinnipediorum]|uniref:Rv2175c family DNA-binding protein n=1 Tax=Arcanobacterium pinnipediorum TaxID=1503041 RepID=A0ABY5AK09_9ACTO|nr:Rv2175c family DNA-binding protein [Arcanobacterium pinnipediorum]USR80111.1 Rv2175c family DNA-binding protein [Arcanobacterium pinnipediorum]
MSVEHEDNVWLSIPEVAELLGLRQRDIRSAIAEHKIIAVRRGENNAWALHRQQLVVSETTADILPSLPGTITTLRDNGFDDEEALSWLTTYNEQLHSTPLEALHSGNIHAVRRAILMLAF